MYKNGKTGISPVIGVILLVAVTVALVSLATVIVFDIGSDVNEPSSSSVQTSIGSNGVQVQVLRNDNVEQFELIGPNGKTDTLDGDVGGSLNMGDGAGQYLIKAILDDNSEEIVNTITIDEDSSASEVRTGTEEVSGTVSVNPNVEGAIVQSIEDGFIIDETTTDKNGEYTIEYSEDSEILVMVDGFDHEELDHTLYASAKRMDLTDNIDFSFEDSVTTVNNENVLIANTVTEEDTTTKTISTLQELQAMNEELDANYELVNDIDASETVDWNDGKGFKPIGDNEDGDRKEDEFTGIFDGQEYEIDRLTINRNENNVGLFGFTDDSLIKNVGLVDNNIVGNYGVGGLIGFQLQGEVSNTYSMGTVEGTGQMGGLMGYNDGIVSESYSTNKVSGDGFNIAGLIGENGGNITKSYATGDVSGTEESIGGFVGELSRDLSSPDGPTVLNNSYVLDNESVIDEMKVIGKIPNVDEDGYAKITHGSNILADDGETSVADIEQELIEEFVRTDSELQNENELEQFNFTDTWIITDENPILQWQE